jgi:heat shock protein HtpX
MVAALESLQRVYGRSVENHEGDDQPALATMKISGKAGGLMALLSTHPPLEERIHRLKNFA